MKQWKPLIQALFGIVAVIGISGLLANFFITGDDVPQGLMTILLSIIGAVYGVEVLSRRKNGNGDGDGNDSDASRR